MRKTYKDLARGSFGVSLLALALASPAQAQSEDSNASDILVTGARATTATKTDTPILRIPQSISIVTSEQIEDRGARSIIEALNYTAGVSNGGDDSRGDFNYIRGFESVLYVDGLKRNYGFVYLPRADINSLERVEVLVGPASVLYGAGSSGGITNMQSKRPKFEFGVQGNVSYGTYDRREAVMDVTGPLSDTLAVRLVGVARDSESMLRYIPNDRLLIQPAITWKPSDNTDVTAIGLYQRDRNGPNQNVNPLPNSIYATPGRRLSARTLLGEPSWQGEGKKDIKSGTLLINHEFSDTFRFSSATRYSKAFTDQREVYPNVYGDPLDPYLDPANEVVARNYFAYRVNYKTFNSDNNLGVNFTTGPFSHKVLVGLDYSYFKQDSAQGFGGTTPINIFNPVYGSVPPPVYTFFGTQILKQTGYYAQNQIDFGEIASLVLGIRRDHYTKEDIGTAKETTNKTTKRAGLTVNVTSTIAPFASYSESFLPIAGLNQFGNTYVPLAGEQIEFGVKWQPRKGTMLRVAYYSLKEANSLQPDPNNPLDSIQSGSVKSKGIEFQIDHEVVDDLQVTASFSHATSRISGQGYQRDSTPKDLASLFATKIMPLSDDVTLRFGGGVRYVGKQTAVAGTYIVDTPSYTLVDALAAVEYGPWKFQVNALNLFNDLYFPSCNIYFCTNGDQRTVQGTLSYRF